MTAEQKAETRFCVFRTAAFGFRALALLLLGYASRYGLVTVSQMISRYAPRSENDTAAYIKSVCDAVGVDKDAVLDIEHNADQLKALCRAIAVHEAGGWFFDANDLDAGVAMAMERHTLSPRIA